MLSLVTIVLGQILLKSYCKHYCYMPARNFAVITLGREIKLRLEKRAHKRGISIAEYVSLTSEFFEEHNRKQRSFQ